MSFVFTRGRQMGMTLQKRKVSLTRAVMYSHLSSWRQRSQLSLLG